MKLRLLAVATVAALLSLSATVHAQDLTSENGKASYALGYRAGNEMRIYTQSGDLAVSVVQEGLIRVQR